MSSNQYRDVEGRKFKQGDYVFSVETFGEPADNYVEHNLMQVRWYDPFGQVVCHFVRHKHRKYVPWDVYRERDLVMANEHGFYGSET